MGARKMGAKSLLEPKWNFCRGAKVRVIKLLIDHELHS